MIVYAATQPDHMAATDQGDTRMFDKKTNIASQEAFGEAVNTGNLSAFDQLVAPDAVDHDPAPGQGAGPDGFKTFFSEMRTAFPDLHVQVETLVADDDQVAFAYTLTGTHSGPFQGNDATGKAFQVRGVQISKFIDGKLVERWGSSDELGIMTQLGLV
ncbi:ester cyclase [Promicromonospora umidemergens]|uniref:ester cyclase n=1 Tax=Promicromonospora umidemergens TaxID=629679 RepID=UPI0020A3BB06|nr:ester cyclase [Promicromonospora umidemergens]